MKNNEPNSIFNLLNEDVRENLIEFLDVNIPYKGGRGWTNHIMDALSSFQKSREYIQPSLQSLDLAELLSVMHYNWNLLSKKNSFTLKDKNTLAQIRSLRNDSAHFKGITEEEKRYQLAIIIDFLKMIKAKESVIERIEILLCIPQNKNEEPTYYLVNTGSYQDTTFTFSNNGAKQLIANRDYLNPDELVDLALCYEFGIGTPIDINEAYSIFSSSSKGKGLFHAGRFLLSHRDYFPESEKKAFQFFRKSATYGFPKAFSAVVYCYHLEIGTKTDYFEMLRFSKKGEEINDPASLRYLGLLARSDNNDELALKYYKKSFELGDCISGYYLSDLMYSKYSNIFDTYNIIEKVLPDLEKYSDSGDVLASYVLGLIYSEGEYWTVDFRKSFKYFFKAAKLNYSPAFIKVANCFWKGNGTAVDRQEAIYWYRKGANVDDVESCIALGRILLDDSNEEIESDYIEAEQCFNRIINLDPKNAYLYKGLLHLKMHFCDYSGYHAEQAFSFFQKGLEAESFLCPYYLGLCYLFEIGTEANKEKAKELFDIAYSNNPLNANIAYPVLFFTDDKERADIILHGLAGYSKDVLAKYVLGEKLIKSIIDAEIKEGLSLMEEAAVQGLAIAENFLGEYLENDDYEKSLRFYKEAALNGFAPAYYNLGRLFEKGKIVAKDKTKAKEYYTLALKNGFLAAEDIILGEKATEEITGIFEEYKSKLRNISIISGVFFQYNSDTSSMKFMDDEALEKESRVIAKLCNSLSLNL